MDLESQTDSTSQAFGTNSSALDGLKYSIGSPTLGYQELAAPPPEAPEVSFSDTMSAAWNSEAVISGVDDIDRLLTSYQDDPNFEVTPDMITAAPDTFDKDQLELLADAESLEEYEALTSEFTTRNEYREQLLAAGWKGTAAAVAVNVLDPAMWGAVLFGEKASASLLTMAKLQRIGKYGKMALTVGAGEATVAALRSQTQSDYGYDDAAIDLLAVAAMTGAITGGGKALEDLSNAMADVKHLGNPGDASAAKTKGTDSFLKARFDEYALMKKSKNATLNDVADWMLHDAVKGGDSSAAVDAMVNREHYLAQMTADFDTGFKAWKKANGVKTRGNVLENARLQDQFSKKVYRAVVADEDHGAEIAKVADRIRKDNEELRKISQDVELNGWDTVDANPNYMQREWDSEALRRLMGQGWTEKDFAELIYQGIARSNRAADELAEAGDDAVKAVTDAQRKLAAGFARRLLNQSDGEARSLDELLEDPESLGAWLRETDASYSDAEIKELLQKSFTSKAKSKNNVIDRRKARVDLDVNAEVNGVKLIDLFNQNGYQMHQRYIQQMTGWHAIARKGGIKSPADLHKLRSSIKSEGLVASGDSKKDLAQFERNLRDVFGKPMFEGAESTSQRSLNMFMKYNFMTAMGKAAFSAMAELGRVVGENGLRNTLRHLPELRRILSTSFANSTHGRTLAAEVNAFNGSIGNEHLMRLWNSFDEHGIREGTHSNGMLTNGEILAHRGANLMAKMSLLAPVDKTLRQLAFSTSATSVYRHLVHGKKTRVPLKHMGLTGEKLERVRTAMKAHSKEGSLGELSDLGIEKWDRQTANDFMEAMTLNNARQVQKSIAGDKTWITEHPLGRIFFQFRTFVINSYTKHFLADLHGAGSGRAGTVVMSTAYAGLFAFLGYYGRSVAATAGMDESDRRAYLRDKLSEERLIANTVAYMPSAGFGSTMWNATGGHVTGWHIPVHRSTGLNTDLLANPTLDKAQRAYDMAKHSEDDGRDQRTAAQKYRAFMLFQNTIPGDVAFNTLPSYFD